MQSLVILPLNPIGTMPASNQLPVSLRYLKARLRILKRPKIWGSLAGLGLVILFLSDYWANPERFSPSLSGTNQSSQGNRTANSELSSLDPAVPGDGDTTEVNSLPIIPSSDLQADPQSDRPASTALPPISTTLPQQPSSSRTSPSTVAVDSNPFDLLNRSSETANPSSFSPFDTIDTNLPRSTPEAAAIPSNGLFGNNSTPPATAAVNPLQSSLERYSALSGAQTNLLTPVGTPTQNSSQLGAVGMTGVPQTTRLLPGQISPNQLLPGQSLYNQTSRPLLPDQSPYSQVPAVPYLPQTSPPPGTTGYTLPPTLRTPSYYSSPGTTYRSPAQTQSIPGVLTPQIVPSPIPFQSSNLGQSSFQTPGYGQSGYGQPSYRPPNYIYPNSPTVQAQPIQPAPAPFSVPRSIGNGQINTFSNP